MSDNDLALVRQSDFFRGMGADGLAELLPFCRVREVPAVRTIFYQDDEAKSFFLVLSGCVKVTKLTESGGQMIRRIVRGCGTLAEAAVFCTGRYPGTAESLADSRLLEVPLGQLVAALGGPNSLAFNMVLGMACQAEKTAGRLEQAFCFTASRRLAAFILGLLPDGQGGTSLRLPYDKCLLALSLGMTPETLSRAFVALRVVGVRTRNRDIFIDEVDRLRRFCGIDPDSPARPVGPQAILGEATNPAIASRKVKTDSPA